MNLLYLAHRIPYPPNKGDKIRSFNEIKYLAQDHTVDLICLADDPEDKPYEEELLKYCRKVSALPISTTWSKIKGMISFFLGRPISVAYFYRNAAQTIINKWTAAEHYDAVICFSSVTAEYVFKSPLIGKAGQGRVSKRPKLIMDFCDVDSDKWLQYAHEAAFLLKQVYRAENARLQAYEKRIYKEFDTSIVISQQEKDLFLRIYPEAEDLTVMPNGVDTDYFAPRALDADAVNAEGLSLIFTGAMDYHANVDGVCWFCENIFPSVRRNISGVRFYIVGRNPAPAVRKLEAQPGVHVVGNVDDIRHWYRKADICVVPLRLARGVQNKILEAMAMEKAVVSTLKANAGIGATDGEHLAIADSAEDFAHILEQLLKEENQRKMLGTNARLFVQKTFSWSKNMELLAEIIT